MLSQILPPEMLLLVFARAGHYELDCLRCTSRGFREAARKQIALRCRLARSAFDTLADEISKHIGSSREYQTAYYRKVFDGCSNGRPVVTVYIRMKVLLVLDRLVIEVTEEQEDEGDALRAYAVRLDVINVWPAENRMDRDLNFHPEPTMPVPEELFTYLCANFMRPSLDNGLEIVCVTASTHRYD